MSGAPTRTDTEARFLHWLNGARDSAVLGATVDQLATRYRLDRRWLETKLLAKQAAIRRCSGPAE